MSKTRLTWKERIVLQLMLSVARYLTADPELKNEIQSIANAISVRGAEPVEDAEEVLHQMAATARYDGGPAFPTDVEVPVGHSWRVTELERCSGLTVRDYFAAQVLSMAAHDMTLPENVAERAYQIADAMLAERKKQMFVTSAYVEAERRKAYGNTVYRCPTCGFQAWGRPVTLHEMVTNHAGMIQLERFIGQEIETMVNRATR